MKTYDGQGFPFSPLQCRQGRTRMRGGVGGSETMCTLHQGRCTLHAVVVLGICLWETWTVVETFLNTRW
jgi:hypothetical protein